MKNKKFNSVVKIGGGLLAGVLTPGIVHACACGCGVFEVGSQSMVGHGAGATAFVEYDAMDQDHNWSGGSGAPAVDNPDRRLRTGFATVGLQYLLPNGWGALLEAPWAHRSFLTAGDDGLVASTHDALGDLRVQAVFAGFAADMATGVSAGLRLATGDASFPAFDRDAEIGSGSTDALLGAWHTGVLAGGGRWQWFADARGDLPFATRGGYRPGDELDASAAVVRAGQRLGGLRLSPRLGLVGSLRAHDGGAAADPPNSSYARLLLAPGLELRAAAVALDLSVALPLAQRVSGDQLVAPALVKLHLSRRF